MSPVYDLGQRLSIGLISGIIANDRWCGLVGRRLLGWPMRSGAAIGDQVEFVLNDRQDGVIR